MRINKEEAGRQPGGRNNKDKDLGVERPRCGGGKSTDTCTVQGFGVQRRLIRRGRGSKYKALIPILKQRFGLIGKREALNIFK